MNSKTFHRGGAEDAEDAEKIEMPDRHRTDFVLSAAIEVHRTLGPGLLESIYHRAMAHELELRGVQCEVHKQVPVRYKGKALDAPLQLDLLVDERIVVEIKSVRALEEVHRAQLLTYLRLAELEVGLLINFNVPVLRQGIKRVVNSSVFSATSASSAPPR
jgi:GxxExxY protein